MAKKPGRAPEGRRNDALSAHFAREAGWPIDDEKWRVDRRWLVDADWRSAPMPPPFRRAFAGSAADWLVDDPRWRVGAAVRPRPSALGDKPDGTGRRVVTLGWHADTPDLRDLPFPAFEAGVIGGKTAERSVMLRGVLQDKGSILVSGAAPPPACLNIDDCSPIEDQGPIGSCTAQAVVGLMEFMMRKGGANHTDGSRLFLYKASRNLLNWTGDTGAYIRTAMKAAVTFGIPPEEYWPYDFERYDEEPSAFLYSFAQSYQAVDYARLDTNGTTADAVIDRVKRTLAAGLGVVFGFSVYDSLTEAPDIPLPAPRDRMAGGHAVMAVGYDMLHQVDGRPVPSLIIRNSWGKAWGINGYGYLPIAYIEQGIAMDFWTAYDWEWIRDGEFY